jgi:hypothetical protein
MEEVDPKVWKFTVTFAPLMVTVWLPGVKA